MALRFYNPSELGGSPLEGLMGGVQTGLAYKSHQDQIERQKRLDKENEEDRKKNREIQQMQIDAAIEQEKINKEISADAKTSLADMVEKRRTVSPPVEAGEPFVYSPEKGPIRPPVTQLQQPAADPFVAGEEAAVGLIAAGRVTEGLKDLHAVRLKRQERQAADASALSLQKQKHADAIDLQDKKPPIVSLVETETGEMRGVKHVEGATGVKKKDHSLDSIKKSLELFKEREDAADKKAAAKLLSEEKKGQVDYYSKVIADTRALLKVKMAEWDKTEDEGRKDPLLKEITEDNNVIQTNYAAKQALIFPKGVPAAGKGGLAPKLASISPEKQVKATKIIAEYKGGPQTAALYDKAKKALKELGVE